MHMSQLLAKHRPEKNVYVTSKWSNARKMLEASRGSVTRYADPAQGYKGERERG